MNTDKIYSYIVSEFNIDYTSKMLILNMIEYLKMQDWSKEEKITFLIMLLDGTGVDITKKELMSLWRD